MAAEEPSSNNTLCVTIMHFLKKYGCPAMRQAQALCKEYGCLAIRQANILYKKYLSIFSPLENWSNFKWCASLDRFMTEEKFLSELK